MRPIRQHNIGPYLNFLVRRFGKAMPPPYHKAEYYAGKTPEEIAVLLTKCYEAAGIRVQKGLIAEEAFAADNPEIQNLTEAGESATKGTLLSKPVPTVHYQPVLRGIGPANYLAYVHWLGERYPALEAFPISVNATTRDEVERLLHRLYQLTSIPTGDAAAAERAFLERYPAASTSSTDTPNVITTPFRVAYNDADRPPPQPAVRKNPAADKKPEDELPASPTVENKKPAPGPTPVPAMSRGKRAAILAGILLLAALGTWITMCYLSYRGLPFIYTLADNVTVRKQPGEQGDIVGRMDIFGEYPDGKGGSMPSASRFKVASDKLTNGYYRILSSEGFFGWLISSEESHLFVHKDFVSEDPAEQQKMVQVFENLRGDFNELDKLNLAVRRLIVGTISGEGAGKTIAPSCEPSAILNKESGVSIFKKYDRITHEVIILLQCTDGYCYQLQGTVDSLPASLARIRTNSGEDLPAGGLFTLNPKTGKCQYRLCETKAVYQALPPYNEFTAAR